MTHRPPLPRFADEAELEPLGPGRFFSGNHLPGVTWQSGNMFTGAFFLPNANMNDAIFNDTVWQFGNPDRVELERRAEDAVLEEIFFSPAMRRLQAIEQLTLPPQFTTIPNTAAFSRFEHLWGSVLFVRQIAQQHGIKGRELTILQLRTLLSDFGHTFGSHLGDWMFQGTGKAENLHDLDLLNYLEAVGINDILRRHAIKPEEVVFPHINDWVEASSPDLCVDRVDYGLREMNRWNDTIRMQGFKAEDFTLTPDNMLAFKDQQRARIFAEGYLLLSQEHWAEPTHQFMIEMLITRTKLFFAEGRVPRTWVFDPGETVKLVDLSEIHPRDLMYITDVAQAHAYAWPQLGGHMLESIMKSVAEYRRQYVWPTQRERIYSYMQQFADSNSYEQIQQNATYTPFDSEEFGSPRNEYPATLPMGFAILDEKAAQESQSPHSIDIPIPPLKLRQIDPLVQIQDGSFARLSTLDPSFATRLEEHKNKLSECKVARLAIPDPQILGQLKSIFENLEPMWQQRLEDTRRMTQGELRNLVEASSVEIHGTYPFMTFLDY